MSTSFHSLFFLLYIFNLNKKGSLYIQAMQHVTNKVSKVDSYQGLEIEQRSMNMAMP